MLGSTPIVRRLPVGLALALWLFGCSFEVDSSRKRCDSAGLCAEGFRCVQNVCVEDDGSGENGGVCRSYQPVCDDELVCVEGRCGPAPSGDAGAVDSGAVTMKDGGPDSGEVEDAGPNDTGLPDAAPACGGAGDPCCAAASCQDGLTCRGDRCICFAELTSNEFETCARTASGAVFCAGRNDHGQIGDGLAGGVRRIPVQVGLPDAARTISCGAFHACATVANDLFCWGSNADGELGLGEAVTGDVPSPLSRAGAPEDIVQLALGGYHSCARTAGDQVWCWGRDQDQQVGLPGPAPRPDVQLPTRVAGLPSGHVSDLTSGGFHTCAIVDGFVWCWGLNGDGQLGVGMTSTSTPTPTQVVTIDHVVDVAAGDWHTCGLRDDGTVWCWGRNASGQLGRNFTGGAQPVPAQVVNIGGAGDPIVAISSMDDHSCAIDREGTLHCWGNDEEGQLGQRVTGPPIPAPVVPQGIGPVLDVAGGRRHTCATTVEGAIVCFGANGYGELGNGLPTGTGTATPSLFACP